MFPSYIKNPSNISFEGQDDDEEILLLLRAHPITNLPWILLASILAILPFILPGIIEFLGFSNLFALPSPYISAFIIVNYLLFLTVVFEGFLTWYFNVYIVTGRKIIDISFESLLRKS